MSVKIVHLADAHLGAPLANFGDYAETRRRERDEAFRRAIGIAIEERAHAVVIAGDLFDTWRPEAPTVNLARRELARLREAGIPAIAVPGTHDSLVHRDCVYRVETLPFHHLFTDPTFADPIALEVAGTRVTFYGIAYDPERSGEGWASLERADDGGIHVAIAHAACRFNPEWPIGPEDLPFEEGDLAKTGMDWVALGHYHNLTTFDDGDRAVGAYPGSLEGRDWTETGPRHVLVIEWSEPGASPAVRPVEVHSRLLETADVDASGLADQREIAEAIRQACDPETLWRVTLAGEPEIVPRPREIEAEIGPAYGHLAIRDETTLVTSRLLEERCEEETVRGEFFRRLLERREEAEADRERAVADRAIKLGLRVFG